MTLEIIRLNYENLWVNNFGCGVSSVSFNPAEHRMEKRTLLLNLNQHKL